MEHIDQTGRQALTCYEFKATNPTQRNITDIHVPIGNDTQSDIPPEAPEGWIGTHDKDGINYVTPIPVPPNPNAKGSRPRPMPAKPILPGKKLDGFKFYLTGKDRAEGIYLTFAESEERLEASVEQGGRVILPSESGTIKPSKTVYCFEITITAPADSPVHVIDLCFDHEIIHASTSPAKGWIMNGYNQTVDGKHKGRVSGFSIGDKNPIPAGGTRKFKIYNSHKPLSLDWTLMGRGYEKIGKGETVLKF